MIWRSKKIGYGIADTTQDTAEPFAYVNFVASGVSFDRIVLDNSGTTSTGFEADNFSVKATAPVIPTTHVLVEQITAVPEPTTAELLWTSLMLFLMARRRFRKPA